MAACQVSGLVVKFVLQFVNFGEFKTRNKSRRLVAINNCESVWTFAFLQPVRLCRYFVSFKVYLGERGL